MKKSTIMIAFTVDMPLKAESTNEQFETFSKGLQDMLELWKIQCEVIAIDAGIQPQRVHFSLDYLSEDSFEEE